jgi:cobalt transporter subunit CbtB
MSQRLIAGVLALFLGLVLVGGVGFASDMAVHNGAHDTRHSLGFPCH